MNNRIQCFFFAAVLLLCACFAHAQNARVDGVISSRYNNPAAGAYVAACAQPATITGSAPYCSPLAPLCASLTDSSCAASTFPVQADGLGNYHFYIPIAEGPFTYCFFGSSLAIPTLANGGCLPDQNVIGAGNLASCIGGINCVTDYPGATADAQITACISALAGESGICDARGYGYSQQTIANCPINVGGTGQSVTLLINVATTFNITCNDPTDYAFHVYPGSTIHGDGTGAWGYGNNEANFQATTANLKGIISNWPRVPTGNASVMSVENLALRSNVGSTITEGLISLSGVYSGTTVQNVNTVYCGGGGAALYITAPTSGAYFLTSDLTFVNDDFDCGGATASGHAIEILDGGSSSGVGSLNFYGSQAQHSALSEVDLNGNGSGQCGSIFFMGFHTENASFNTVPAHVTINDCHNVTFDNWNTSGATPSAGNVMTVAQDAANATHDIYIRGSRFNAGTNVVSSTVTGLNNLAFTAQADSYMSVEYFSGLPLDPGICVIGGSCGGGGGGTVTSVTGTANQITATGTTSVVLSLPSAIVAPGTISATAFEGSGGLNLQSTLTAGCPSLPSPPGSGLGLVAFDPSCNLAGSVGTGSFADYYTINLFSAASVGAATLGTGGGTANAQTWTHTNGPTITSYGPGMIIEWVPAASNTSTTPTMTADSGPTDTIVKVNSATSGGSGPAFGPLAANDIYIGGWAYAMYNATVSEWILLNPTSGSGSAGTSALSGLTAAISSNTIANGNFPQQWNWFQTTGSQSAITFGETSAATGSGDIEVNIRTLNGSTAFPLQVTAGGTANGVQMSTSGVLSAIGSGQILATNGVTNPCASDSIGSLLYQGSSVLNCLLAPTGPTGVPNFVYTVPGAATSYGPAGVPIDVQATSSYSLALTDRGQVVDTTNSTGSTGFAVASPGSSGYGQSFPFVWLNSGSVVGTATPTSSTVNGNATLKMVGAVSGHNPEASFWWTDNTNWWSAVVLPTDANGFLAAEGIASGSIINSMLAHAAITVQGQTCTLGLSCNINSVTTAHGVALNEGSAAQLGGTAVGATGTVLCGNTAADPSFCTVPIFAATNLTGNTTLAASDFSTFASKYIASGSPTITLVASGSQPANGQSVLILNYGGGTPIIARSGQNINGAASNITLSAGSASAPTGGLFVSDGTNYEYYPLGGSGGGGSGVSSFTGDGALLSNSASTGAVTATLVNAGAGTVWGNNTGSSASATYTPTPNLGVSGTAGTLGLFAASGNFKTTLGSAATASNTFNFPAAVFTTGHMGYCVTSSTTCTWTDTGYAYNAIPNADLANSAITIGGTSVSLGGSTSSFPNPGTIGGTTPGIGDFSALNCGVSSTTACILTGYGSTSGTATLTWPAVAGTTTNAIVSSNNLSAPGLVDSGLTTSNAIPKNSSAGLLSESSLVDNGTNVSTSENLLVTGILDGTAPITITTGTSANLGSTYSSGYTFNQEGTAGTGVTYTLPATAVGKQYCVQNSGTTSVVNSGVLTVYPPSSSYVILNGVVNTVGGGGTHGVASGGAAGDSACFVAIDATHWEVFVGKGTWTEN